MSLQWVMQAMIWTYINRRKIQCMFSYKWDNKKQWWNLFIINTCIHFWNFTTKCDTVTGYGVQIWLFAKAQQQVQWKTTMLSYITQLAIALSQLCKTHHCGNTISHITLLHKHNSGKHNTLSRYYNYTHNTISHKM